MSPLLSIAVPIGWSNDAALLIRAGAVLMSARSVLIPCCAVLLAPRSAPISRWAVLLSPRSALILARSTLIPRRSVPHSRGSAPPGQQQPRIARLLVRLAPRHQPVELYARQPRPTRVGIELRPAALAIEPGAGELDQAPRESRRRAMSPPRARPGC